MSKVLDIKISNYSKMLLLLGELLFGLGKVSPRWGYFTTIPK